MLGLKINQVYFLRVVPEWYTPELLSGIGTIEEQICEHEKERIESGALYIADLKRGETTVEIFENVGYKEVEQKPHVHTYINVTDGDNASHTDLEEQEDAEENLHN